MLVRPGTPDDATFAASLHAAAIPRGFLTLLGQPFLRRLYRRIARSSSSVLLVAELDGRPAGFVAGSENLRRLYLEFAVRDGVAAGLVCAPRLARSLRQVLENLRYAGAGPDLPEAELLSLAVAPSARGRGVGHALVHALTEEFRGRGVAAARLVVAEGNTAAAATYSRSGWRRARTRELHAGQRSEVWLWHS